MQQVRLMMFSLNTVDYSMSFLLLSTQNFFCWTSRGDHSEPFLLFEVYCGIPPSCLKVRGGGGGWWWWWVAWSNLVSAQGPFLGFWVWGFGVWGLGLTIGSSSGSSSGTSRDFDGGFEEDIKKLVRTIKVCDLL